MADLHSVWMMIVVLATLLLATAQEPGRTWEYAGQKWSSTINRTSDDTKLPGLCDDVNQTAGYIKISGSRNKNYFYWFFESRNDPTNDPVLLWMTGGPGCSSAIALFHELGPCKIESGIKTNKNPHSWNLNASIIFIDQPAGVGFSYGDFEDADSDENMVSEDMFHFMHQFFDEIRPDLKQNPLFVFGESYGGHYAPNVAHRIGKTLNLQGLGVGNGLTDPEIQYQYYPEMVYEWAINVTGKPVVSKLAHWEMKRAMPKCIEMIKKCQNDTQSCGAAQAYCNEVEVGPYSMTGLNPYDFREPCKVKPLCYDFSDVEGFLGSEEVLSALGVDPSFKWKSCNYTVNSMFKNDWMKNYQMLIPDLLANGTRVMIYAGDCDFICNWIGNKAWTLALPWQGKDAFNAAPDTDWCPGGKTGGKVRSSQGFSFLQVSSAGHMVPLDQPENALTMFNDFILGNAFATC